MTDCTKRKICPDHQCERPDERVPSYAWHACKVWRRLAKGANLPAELRVRDE